MEELDIGGDDEDAEDYYEDDDEYQDVAEDEGVRRLHRIHYYT